MIIKKLCVTILQQLKNAVTTDKESRIINNLADNRGNIKFYLPFDDFKTRPMFNWVSEYLP